MIKNSLEWTKQEFALKRKAQGLSHYQDVLKMIESITKEVSELSKAEVLVRQGRRSAADEILIKVNQDIELVEEYILVAALLG